MTVYAVTDVTTTSVTMEGKPGIPANKGAILFGSEGDYKLTIATADAWSASKLEGTLVNKQLSVEAYVLSKPEGQSVGLYLARKNLNSDSQWLSNANKAYLPASHVPEGNARFLTFDFGTETGIKTVENAEADNAVIYDLSGRRVRSAQKGLYIVNGKKVVK